MNEKISLKRYDNKEYIIRDELEIIIGRFILLEEDEENRYISFRLYYYREDKKLLGLSLIKMINLCRISGFNKLSLYSEFSCSDFSDSGFILEGVVTDRIKEDTKYKSLYLFGIVLSGEKTINKTLTIINGDRIVLKIFTPDDSEKLLNFYIRNREYLKPFDPLRKEEFFTLEAQRKDLENSFNDYLNGKSYNFGIFKDGSLIGKIRISSIVYGVFHNAFIGYSIDESQQRKGYMKEAVRLITDFCFNEIDIHRIEASTLVDNIASQKVLSGTGFNTIGLCPKYLFINGEWRDHYIFYKLKDN